MISICRCALTAALVFASTAGAQAPNDGEATDSTGWSFTITPYLWAAGIDGDTAAEGTGAEIDTGYSFLSLNNLDLVLATGVEGARGDGRCYWIRVYVDFSDSFESALLTTDAEALGRLHRGFGRPTPPHASKGSTCCSGHATSRSKPL